MPNYNDKIKQNPSEVIKAIIKREGISATKLALQMNVSDQALRKRLRGGSKFSINEFVDILNYMGYEMGIVKKTDIIN